MDSNLLLDSETLALLANKFGVDSEILEGKSVHDLIDITELELLKWNLPVKERKKIWSFLIWLKDQPQYNMQRSQINLLVKPDLDHRSSINQDMEEMYNDLALNSSPSSKDFYEKAPQVKSPLDKQEPERTETEESLEYYEIMSPTETHLIEGDGYEIPIIPKIPQETEFGKKGKNKKVEPISKFAFVIVEKNRMQDNMNMKLAKRPLPPIPQKNNYEDKKLSTSPKEELKPNDYKEIEYLELNESLSDYEEYVTLENLEKHNYKYFKNFCNVSRKEAEELLQELPEGSFLFRPGSIYDIVLSFVHSNTVLHMPIKQDNKGMLFCHTKFKEPVKFYNLQELKEHFSSNLLNFKKKNGTMQSVLLIDTKRFS